MERIKALFVSEDVEYAATVAACMRSINVPADFTITSEFTDAYAKTKSLIYALLTWVSNKWSLIESLFQINWMAIIFYSLQIMLTIKLI